MKANLKLQEYLKKAGLTQAEIDMLLAQYLEEEAFPYLKAMEEFADEEEKKIIFKQK